MRVYEQFHNNFWNSSKNNFWSTRNILEVFWYFQFNFKAGQMVVGFDQLKKFGELNIPVNWHFWNRKISMPTDIFHRSNKAWGNSYRIWID